MQVAHELGEHSVSVGADGYYSLHMPAIAAALVNAVNEQSRTNKEQARALDEQSRTIKEQSRTIKEQARALDEQRRMIGELRERMAVFEAKH